MRDVISRIHLVVQPQAIPLSVTTRGIGFNVALFYDRAITTWNLQQITAIATIHQVYRVAIYLAHYKAYLAQQCQVELSTDPLALDRFEIPDRIREILSAVTVIPSSLALVINNIGKVQTKAGLYFMGYAIQPTSVEDLMHYRKVVVNPSTIRPTLEFLANVNTPRVSVEDYLNHNSIPGLAIEDGHLVNINDVWPENYGANSLSADVAAFNNLITRVQGRLPKHSFYNVVWDGRADSAGLWSSELIGASLTALMYRNPEAGAPAQRKRRGADGSEVLCVGLPRLGFLYQRSTICDRNTEFWSPEETSVEHAVAGTASFVGESCFVHTRYHLSCGYVTSVHPIQTLRSIVTAPR